MGSGEEEQCGSEYVQGRKVGFYSRVVDRKIKVG